MIEHGAIGAALGRLLARRDVDIAIEAILADIEKEGGEVVVREIVQRAGVAAEFESVFRVRFPVDNCTHLDVEISKRVQHVALQLRHFRDGDAISLLETCESAK